MVVWDNDFQAAPEDTDAANQGANAIRQFKEACNERFELEMNFRDGGQPFLKAGIAAVINANATGVIDGLSSPSNGALAFDTTTKNLRYYASGWQTAGLNHATLANLTSGDPHTQYLAKAGGTMTGNIVMGSGNTVDGIDVGTMGAAYVVTAVTVEAHVANNVAHANTYGEWTNNSGAGLFTYNANYTAATDGFVVAYSKTSMLCVFSPYAGTSVYRALSSQASNSYWLSVCSPIRKGDEWRVGANGDADGVLIYWMPVGS